MKSTAVYLDHNATSPLRPEVGELMRELELMPLNASSIHSYGQKASQLLGKGRSDVARQINAFDNEVVFTASATEANNLAIHVASKLVRQRNIVISAVEHDSIEMPFREWCKMTETDDPYRIPVNVYGLLELDYLERHLQRLAGDPIFVSIILANNETGVIQPIKDVVALARKYGALVHTDATQAMGRIYVDFSDLGVDMMTIAAHKMGGPKGVGALVVKRNSPFTPMIYGGRQEERRRAGTENIAAIAGFGEALERVDYAHYRRMQEWIEEALLQCSIDIHGEQKAREYMLDPKRPERLPNTHLFWMPGVNNETQLIFFDVNNIAISAGSACSSGRVEPSRVLLAAGLPEEYVTCMIRLSGGWNTTEVDIQRFTTVWKTLYQRCKNERKSLESAAG